MRTMSARLLLVEEGPPAPHRRRLVDRLLDRAGQRGAGAPGRRRREAAVAAVLLATASVLWVGDDPYRLSLMVLSIAYALLGIGIYVPLVLGARLSVCYNAYFASGAYAVGLVATKTSLPLALAIPIGMVAAALIGAAVSFACRGLSGYHLAVATIGVAHVADRVIIDRADFTGGSTGIGGIPSLAPFGVTLTSSHVVVGGLVVLWLAACTVNRLRDSVWGFALRLQRDAPTAAEACGASVESLRSVSVCLGAAIGSLAGVLLALVNRFIIPESFAFLIVFTIIFVPILGGAATAWGSLIGAPLVVWLNTSDAFGDISGALAFGIGTLIVLVAAPAGCLGILYTLSRNASTLLRRLWRATT